jgi:signal transduction histidine kinase
MPDSAFIFIFFFYGLAFFCMGLAVFLEIERSSEERLKYALPPLAIFGILHGAHEWYDMFERLNILPNQAQASLTWDSFRLVILCISFLSLAIFGVWMFAKDSHSRRVFLLIPLLLVAIWGLGTLLLSMRYSQPILMTVIDVWSRYILGIPSALLACAGLIYQQRELRRQGMAQFGRSAMWAAVAFLIYGLIGQSFIRQSPLFPSTIWNSVLFQQIFGFPIQLLRAVCAIFVAFFIIYYLRVFEVENQRRIRNLQDARLQEASHKEALRGEMFHRIVEAQEAERQRMARDLHDATGQSLTAIGLGLRSVSSHLPQDIGKAESNLHQIQSMVASAIEELQRLIADLRPSHLDDLGLPATLRWYSGEIQKRAPLQIDLEITGKETDLPSEVKMTLFRITQEALTNVIKHADATKVNIFLFYNDNNKVIVRISDNGKGFNVDGMNLVMQPSWGILGMRERVSLLGGNFKLFSRPGQGTRIEVEIPYQQKIPGDNG